MGIKIILTESQVANLEKSVGKVDVTEMGRASMSCSTLYYDSLMDLLGNKDEKKVGYETIIRKIPGSDSSQPIIGIRHYRTDIIRVRPDNVLVIDVNNYETKTTKDRLNTFLGCKNIHISQKNFKWTLHTPFGSVPYEDGIEIMPDGQAIPPGGVASHIKSREKERLKAMNIDPKFWELYGINGDPNSN